MIFFKDRDKTFKSKKREALEEDETLKKLRDQTEFEKGDFFALVIALFITALPVVAVLLFFFYFLLSIFFS